MIGYGVTVFLHYFKRSWPLKEALVPPARGAVPFLVPPCGPVAIPTVLRNLLMEQDPFCIIKTQI